MNERWSFDRRRNERRVARLRQRADRIIALSEQIAASDGDEQLRERFGALRERLAAGQSLEQVCEEGFACVRVAAGRTMGMQHRPVQVIAGLVMQQGGIAELATGEGKTLSATLPLALNALAGPVHCVTTNDYLADRDAEWMRPVFTALGLSVGALQEATEAAERRLLYQGDILYGTPAQFGFDYLRDHLARSAAQTVGRDGSFVLVDEADSVLIDEARTPLIISASPPANAASYQRFAAIAAQMEEGVHFQLERKEWVAYPTEEGVALAERLLGIEHLYQAEHTDLINHLIQALKARTLTRRDVEYVVEGDEVKIVDEATGRVMDGRRWSDGLHQAIEAKEGLEPRAEQVVVAEITLQHWFRRYPRLGGMTGTAFGERKELWDVYGLEVVQVPPHRPRARLDRSDRIYRTVAGKEQAVVAEIKRRQAKGQPVLVGTASVEASERLSAKLDRAGVRHEVLNAKNHAREALIISRAGERGAVTVATNMAGRGVDIKIDDEVRSLGGLCVIGSERHEARRIDDQLRGRSGRQGDPGESIFFLSAQDELVQLFAGNTLERLLARIGPADDSSPIVLPAIARQIASAQRKVEERNALARKRVLRFGDALAAQRQLVYAERERILAGEDVHETIRAWLQAGCAAIAAEHDPLHAEPEDAELLQRQLQQLYPTGLTAAQLRAAGGEEQLRELIEADIDDAFRSKEEYFGSVKALRSAEREMMLRLLDHLWQRQLTALNEISDGIHLRSLVQRDPFAEYTREAGLAYERMVAELQERLPGIVLRVRRASDLPQTAASPV